MSEGIERLILDNPNFTSSRLPSLYSNFNHLKEHNPDGYEANITTWVSALQQLIKANCFEDSCSVDSDKLADLLSLHSKNMRPKGLNKVIDRMIENNLLIPYSKFKSTSVKDFQNKGLIKSIMKWSPVFNPTFISGSDDENGTLKKGEKYILVSQLQESSKELALLMNEEKPAVISPKALKLQVQKRGSLKLSDFDLECCLHYLENDVHEVRITQNGNIQFIKDRKEVLSDEQIDSIAQLKYTQVELESHIHELDTKLEEIETELKSIIKKNNGTTNFDKVASIRTKSLLSIRKSLQASAENTNKSLANLTLVLLQIADAKNNLLTMQTLESNALLLKNLNQKVGDADAVMKDVRNEVEKVHAVSDSLSTPAGRIESKENEEEDEELERMLQNLELEEKEKQLPKESAPEHNINSLIDADLEARFNRLKIPTSIPSAEENDLVEDSVRGEKSSKVLLTE